MASKQGIRSLHKWFGFLSRIAKALPDTHFIRIERSTEHRTVNRRIFTTGFMYNLHVVRESKWYSVCFNYIRLKVMFPRVRLLSHSFVISAVLRRVDGSIQVHNCDWNTYNPLWDTFYLPSSWKPEVANISIKLLTLNPVINFAVYTCLGLFFIK